MFQENVEFTSSINWNIDFYLPTYNLIILCLNSLNEIYRLMFIAQDIMRNSEASIVIVTDIPKLPFRVLRLASIYGIPIIHVKNLRFISEIIDGALSAYEVNSKFTVFESRVSPRIADKCRMAILDLLSRRPLTKDELVEFLSREFPVKTIEWCLLCLRRSGKVKRLAFLRGSRKAVYGISEEQLIDLPKFYNISREWSRKINAFIITSTLKEFNDGLTASEISRYTGLKITQVIASLRYLENRGIIGRRIINGKIYWKCNT